MVSLSKVYIFGWNQQTKKNQRIEGNLRIYLDLHCWYINVIIQYTYNEYTVDRRLSVVIGGSRGPDNRKTQLCKLYFIRIIIIHVRKIGTYTHAYTRGNKKIGRLVYANGRLGGTVVTIILIFTFITILTVSLPAHLQQTKSICAIIYLYVKKLYYASKGERSG
jgi:hypothetical protein